jgi:diguanylate cyclase (GGDEF)-like protein
MRIGEWAYIMLMFLILITSFYAGIKFSFVLVGYTFLADIVLKFLSHIYLSEGGYFIFFKSLQDIMHTFSIYFVFILFSVFCSVLYKNNYENEQQNKKLFMEIANKYEQLSAAQEEIKSQNDKLRECNSRLEEANKKFMTSLAELFTLQQITQAISSILDIKELLKSVNDIIIGVMGVSSSTIILYDDNRGRLKVHTTNITNRKELIILNDNINCEKLLGTLQNGEPILENFVDVEEYPFAEGRGVNSLLCVPLSTKAKKFGLVLIEHKYFSAFDDNNLRLLNIIGQQVGIAMENVELYQKMHEMATIDSLTGIYNRLYFQERLREEIANAKRENYDLSLAIMDIDYFKRFNDTFGHLFGDKVLKHIANLIKKSLRSGDIIARYGGEEFVILLPRTSIKEAYDKVERLRNIISKTSIKDELVEASVTVSFGVSSYPEFSNTESELLKTADNALYEAKESGRNCVRIPC